jgi:hypothetical protein
MIIKKRGNKYNFEIVSQKEGDAFSFFIKAKSKTSGRTSCINNLNTVLSEFDVQSDDLRFADSTWMVKENEARYLINTTIEFLSDHSFLNYLEGQLDYDRMLGEWENTR